MRNGGSGGSRQLLHAVALLAFTGVALAGAALGEEDDTEPARGGPAGLDADALARISVAVTPKVAERVERIRGLEFEQVPQPRVVDAEFMNELGAREARRAGATRGLAVDEAAARLLGLLPEDEGLEAVLDSTGDLAAAAYDTRRDRLYVIEDAAPTNRTLVEFFLAHELTHALEDEHFGLPHTQDASDDGAFAELSLIEGTATAVMIEYGRLHLDPGKLLAASLEIDAGRGDVPSFVVEQLELAYLRGAAFVEELHALADGWTLVNDALVRRPPVSSEQILHPQAYVRVEAPQPTSIDGRVLERRGWRRAGGGDLGETATGQLLRVGAPGEVAQLAAEGWSGDHYALWARERAALDCTAECREELVLVARWRWDSPREADEFTRTLPAYLIGGLDGEESGGPVEGSEGERDRGFALDGGWAAIAREPRTITLAFAPGKPLAALAAAAP